MARKIRIEYPGAIYHVMNRGDRREAIFKDVEDQDLGEEWKSIRRGWCLGEEAFRDELLAQISGRMGEHHYGTERKGSAEERAERIVIEELRKSGWAREELSKRAKGDPVKLAVAVR